jgi:hypothetical protein
MSPYGSRQTRQPLLVCWFKQDTAERLHTPRYVRRHSLPLPDDDAPADRLISIGYPLHLAAPFTDTRLRIQ